MYNKKRQKRRKKIFIITTISIITLVLSIIFSSYTNLVENIGKSITLGINKLIFYPTTVSKVDQSESYLIQKNVNESLEKEIQELKDILDLNQTLTEYKAENATVLSRNKSYWFNTLTIDKGKNSGIKEGMAVITKAGLVGKVSKVYSSTSEIKLITSIDANFKVSVGIKVADKDTYAILNGYDYKNSLLKVVGVDKSLNIENDTPVVTSGLGDLFPRGIYVGTVEKQENDKYNLSKTLYLKTAQDFNNIHYVSILKEHN